MSTPEKNQGPKAGQIVLYNNAGTVRPGIIYRVNADGTVDISQFATGTAVVDRLSTVFDPNLGASKWAYPDSL